MLVASCGARATFAQGLLVTGEAAPERAFWRVSAWKGVRWRLALDETRNLLERRLRPGTRSSGCQPQACSSWLPIFQLLVVVGPTTISGSWLWWGRCRRPGGMASASPPAHGNIWEMQFTGSCCPAGSARRSPEPAWASCRLAARAQVSLTGRVPPWSWLETG